MTRARAQCSTSSRRRILASMLVIAGCSTGVAHDGSKPGRTEPPSPAAVVATLRDGPPASHDRANFTPDEPERLRPCCAFGVDLEVKVGAVGVPGFALETVRGPVDVGAHSYGAGLVQLTKSPAGDDVPNADERPSHENNGIVYTCRGGFIDTAHLRDYADLATYLATQIAPALETGTSIDLAEQGGERRVVVHPIEAQAIERAGRTRLASAIAGWLTFELSVWREIATWYGHESVPPWPEKISSFSLEDLYSNLLGTKLSAAVLAGAPKDEREYDRAMTAWLDATLATLGVVSKEDAAAAMRAVEGAWWDAKREVPDWKVQRRRRFDGGPAFAPWLVPMATPSPVLSRPKRVAVAPAACRPDERPFELRHDTRVAGIDVARIASVEIDVSDKLMRRGIARSTERRHLTQRDFPMIARRIRDEISREIGEPCDRP